MAASTSPAAAGPFAIETKALTKTFGHFKALKGVQLNVKRGESLTTFGPNGAGKSTLLRLLATISRPTSGHIVIDGLDAQKNSIDVKRRIGVVMHQTLLYDDLTAYENLDFYGRMYDVPNLDARIHELLGRVGLAIRLHDQVRTFSRGMQQRLSIARAVLHSPSVLLLDEPETGLDQQGVEMFRKLLEEFRCRGGSVVQATHSLERGLQLSDRVIILTSGKIVYEELTTSLTPATFCDAYFQHTGARL